MHRITHRLRTGSGLAVIPGYVGIKMLIVEWYPAWISLPVIIGVLTTGALTF